jgi:hypothetical protein
MNDAYRWNHPRWLYFAQQEPRGLIKIGHSDAPRRRVLALWPPDSGRRGADLLATITLDPDLSLHDVQQNHERRMQVRFAHAHFVGEWFLPTPDLLTFIASLTPEAIAT